MRLVGAGVAFFAMCLQIQATQEMEKRRQKTERDRALSTLLADLSVNALELHTIHGRMLETLSSFDKNVLPQHSHKLIRSASRLISLPDMDNQDAWGKFTHIESKMKKHLNILI